MNVNCIRCKSRLFCGKSSCTIIAKSNAVFKVKSLFNNNLNKENFSSFSPSPFIGHTNYPKINIGFLAPPELPQHKVENNENYNQNTISILDRTLYDSPREWNKQNFNINRLIEIRSSLINSRFTANVNLHLNVNSDKSKYISHLQEIGASIKPPDIEFKLKDKPTFNVNYDSHLSPHGPNANVRSFNVTSNPKIPAKLDKVMSDTDLKASDALTYLYRHGFDENILAKSLSVGNFGLKKSRKLVPTRWSITATDDTIGKDIINKIKDYSTYDYAAYFGSYLGNYFLVLCFPDVWSYELFETYMPSASWNITKEVQFTTDFEGYEGRKSYAENCAGGYYASRLAVLEKLLQLKKQSSVLVIRVITGEYIAPMGVWVVREAARNAVSQKPIKFSSKELMLNYAKILIKKKFGYDISPILQQSKLLRYQKTQTKLTGFL